MTLWSVLVGMIAVALFDFCLGGVIFRYSCDLTLIGAFAAMAVAFSLHDEAEDCGGVARKGSAFVIAAVCLASIIISLSLAMSLNANLTAYSPEAYVRFRDLFLWY